MSLFYERISKIVHYNLVYLADGHHILITLNKTVCIGLSELNSVRWSQNKTVCIGHSK